MIPVQSDVMRALGWLLRKFHTHLEVDSRSGWIISITWRGQKLIYKGKRLGPLEIVIQQFAKSLSEGMDEDYQRRHLQRFKTDGADRVDPEEPTGGEGKPF